MFHFIRFAAGVLTGVAAVTLIKSKKTRAGLEKAEDKLRGAQAGAPKPQAASLKRTGTTAKSKKTQSSKE